MKLNIERGKRGSFWSTKFSSDLSMIRTFDKKLGLITLFAFILCVIACYFMSASGNFTIYDMVPVLTLPLFLDGILIYVYEKRVRSTILLIVVVAALVVLHYMGIINLTATILFFILFILIGGTGVVAMVEAIQRATFYKVVHSIEYMNVKSRMSIFDKIVSFIFNVPEDLDTRNITMNYNLQRTSIPWKEMTQTILMALMLGMVIWIYMSMNPSFMNPEIYESTSSVPIYMFSLILVIPLIVLPFTIFKSLDVRVETNYRAFHIHSGALETIKRMALPIGATLIFVLLAINTAEPKMVLSFIGVSALAIIFVVGYICVLYYTTNERPLVKDIVAKWRVFRPVPIFIRLYENERPHAKDQELPGTPERDTSEFGELTLPQGR